jgi:thiamine biosynthesis lipoprotein ApbE
MVADALGTAAFILGPDRGIDLLERHGLEGMVVDDALAVTTTGGWSSLRE